MMRILPGVCSHYIMAVGIPVVGLQFIISDAPPRTCSPTTRKSRRIGLRASSSLKRMNKSYFIMLVEFLKFLSFKLQLIATLIFNFFH